MKASTTLIAWLIFSASTGSFVVVHAPSYRAACALVK